MSLAAARTPRLRGRTRALAALAAPAAGAFVVLLPVIVVLGSLLRGDGAAQAHVFATTGPVYLGTTLILCAAVGLGAALLGVATAAFAALTEFPGRKILAPLLVAPFAVPAYISAYAWADALGPFGLLGRLGFSPDIRSLPGAAFILTLALYPYVYLAMRASFAQRSGAYLEAARASGAGPAAALTKALLPMGRAAFAGGLALALMETAADYGVAEHFGVLTLGVGIFRTWHGLGDLVSASQLAAGLFAIATLFILVEEAARRGLGAESGRVQRAPARIALSPPHAAIAVLVCAAPVLLGFVFPAAVLALQLPQSTFDPAALWRAAANTGAVAAASAIAATLLACAIVFSVRRSRSQLAALAFRAATLGYALPGAVVAIGVLGAAKGAGLYAGLFVLLYAYVARFLTAATNAAAAGAAQIHPQTDDAARSLGAGAVRLALQVQAPLAAPALRAGLLVVFIDVARELPATLLLRPFNFETLATSVFRLASDERFADAAPAALALVLLSMLPAFLADASLRGGRSGDGDATLR